MIVNRCWFFAKPCDALSDIVDNFADIDDYHIARFGKPEPGSDIIPQVTHHLVGPNAIVGVYFPVMNAGSASVGVISFCESLSSLECSNVR